jgi:16S rRNA (cytidine1402-2'-O)-methyltransferase
MASGDPPEQAVSREAPGEAPPGLSLVATPIGNLGDLSPRALRVLGAVDAVLCEDTRVTGQMLARYGLSAPLLPLHDHNEAEMVPPPAGPAAGGGNAWRWPRMPARRWSPTPATGWCAR